MMETALKNVQDPLRHFVGTRITAVDAEIGIFQVQLAALGIKHREALARCHGNTPTVHVVDSGLQAF